MTSVKVLAVIPARFSSQRFPGKPLANILGKPMIQWVYERAQKAKLLSHTIIATDDERIFNVVKGFGADGVMTSTTIPNGSERVAVVARQLDYPIVVNIQGDEPFIDPDAIDKAVELLLKDDSVMVGTLIKKIENISELENTNLPKVVIDSNNYALYFSRSIIPYNRDNKNKQDWLKQNNHYRHVGLYVYRNKFLQQFIKLPMSKLEKMEKLEQLRILENGYKIKVAEVNYAPQGVDTPEDLDKLISDLKENLIE